MRIADYAAADLVMTGLDAQTKEEVLQRMVDLLVSGGHLRSRDVVMGELQKRERVMSTGIGGGIALPHALSDDLDKLYMVFAHTTTPLDFEALDSQPVDLVFMLVGPKVSGNMYVKLLARVSRLLQSEDFKSRLREAATPEAVLEVFRHEE